MNRSLPTGLIAGLVLAALGLGVWSLRPHPAAAPEVAAAAEPKPLYWYDPMVPDQRFDKPGKSPFMDMQLVPKYADDPAAGASSPSTDGSFAIDARVVQTLGIRLAPVTREALAREVRATGVIAIDEHRIESVQVRAAGWVEKLAVRAAGDPVQRGALLASVYAPELLAAQQEFLLAQKSGDAGLREAAASRLALFGLSAAQIARVAASGQAERRVDYHAPFTGYVMELGVRQGAAVQPGMTLFQIASLESVWLNAEVPEAQAGWIKAGDRATVELPAEPGETRSGKVDYLYPELVGATRTLKLRVQIPNADGRLRPGMYAAVQLRAAPRPASLTVPSEAVIRTGMRSVVLLAEADGRYRPVIVKPGVEIGERSEILDGLEEGQQVVASGQFLIDSEATLRGMLERLTGPTAEPVMAEPAGHTGHAP